MARKPVASALLLPTAIPDPENRQHLVDLDRQLRAQFFDLGDALNDDLLIVSDWVTTVTFADTPYAMRDTDRFLLVDTTGGAVVVTLPLAADMEPHLVGIKKTIAANTVTINRAGSDTIDGLTSKVLTAQYEVLLMISDKAAAWHVLHFGAP